MNCKYKEIIELGIERWKDRGMEELLQYYGYEVRNFAQLGLAYINLLSINAK